MSRFKYGKTFHLPWSLGITKDDKVMKSTDAFHGEEVVVTEKMDGENTTMYSDHIHARSLDSVDHLSRHWVKGLWGQMRYNIPEGWRVCGENIYAEHSIPYDNLKSFFMVFNIWNEENVCLSWDDTLEWCELLGLQAVPVLYRGIYDEKLIKALPLDYERQEGYVVRISKSFHYNDFKKFIGKNVRKGHVQTDEHWMNKPVVPNKIANE